MAHYLNCSLFELLNVPSPLYLEFFPTDPSNNNVLSTFLPQAAATILSLTTSYTFFVESNHYPLSQCQKLMSITIISSLSLGPTIWFPPLDSIKDAFLDGLTLPIDHSTCLAPALEILECHSGGDFSDTAVLRFIKSQQSRPDIANLKRIFIAFTRPKEIDFSSDQEVAQYVVDGLDINRLGSMLKSLLRLEQMRACSAQISTLDGRIHIRQIGELGNN